MHETGVYTWPKSLLVSVEKKIDKIILFQQVHKNRNFNFLAQKQFQVLFSVSQWSSRQLKINKIKI